MYKLCTGKQNRGGFSLHRVFNQNVNAMVETRQISPETKTDFTTEVQDTNNPATSLINSAIWVIR